MIVGLFQQPKEHPMIDSGLQIVEEKPDHAFRTEIPNIVFELGLTPYEFALYAYYKRVAGDSSSCSKYRSQIQEETGISSSQQKRINLRLKSSFDKLMGKSLINCIETTLLDGGPSATCITIVEVSA